MKNIKGKQSTEFLDSPIKSYEMPPSDNDNNDLLQNEIIQNTRKTQQISDLKSKKIREQAKRLCEMQEYIIICEKKIKLLSPSIEFPISNSSLTTEERKYPSDELNLLRELIEKKDKEIDRLKKGASILTKNLLLGSCERYPNFDKIPDEKKSETYSKLLNSFETVLKEKEEVLTQLRKETLNNEEQRNYIEILKQSIERKMQKLNLQPVSSQKTKSIDYFITLTQYEDIITQLKKELVKNETVINEKNQELNFLKSKLNSVNDENSKINEIVKKLNEENSNSERNQKEYFNKIQKLSENNQSTNEKVIELEKNNKLLAKINDTLKQEKEETSNINKELETKLLELNSYKSKLSENIMKFEKAVDEKNEIALQNELLKNEVKILKDQSFQIKSSYDKICKELDTVNEASSKEKNRLSDEIENLIRQNKLYEKKKSELNLELEETKKNLDILMDKNSIITNDLEIEKKINQQLSGLIDELKQDYSNKFDHLQANVESYEKTCQSIKSSNENFENENKRFNIEINKLSNENSNLIKENLKIKKDNEQFIQFIERISIDNNELTAQNKLLVEENLFLRADLENSNTISQKERMRYENDLKLKNQETDKISDEIKELALKTKKLNELNKESNEKIRNLSQEVDKKNITIKSLENQNNLIKERDTDNTIQISELKEISIKYEFLLKEKEEITKNSKELKNRLENILIKYNELEENLKEKEQSLFQMKESNRKLNTEIRLLNQKLDEEKDQNDSLRNQNLSLNNKITSFEFKNNNLNKINNDWKSKLDDLNKDLEEKDIIIKKLKEEKEIGFKKERELSNSIKLKDKLVEESNEKSRILTIILKNFSETLKKMIEIDSKNTEKSRSIFTKNFLVKSKELISKISEEEFENEKEFLIVIFDEFEILFNNIMNVQSEILSTTNNFNEINEKNRELEKSIENQKQITNKLEKKFIELSDCTSIEKLQISDLKRRNENLSIEVKEKASEIMFLKNESNDLKNKFSQINNLIFQLKEDNSNLQIAYEKHYQKSNTYELKSTILSQIKISYEAFINKLVRQFPSRELVKIVSSIMQNFEEIFKNERQKLMYELELKQKNDENKSMTIESNEVIKNKIIEIENKITNLKETQCALENEIKRISEAERKKFDCIYEKEIKIKQLEVQINQISEEFNNSFRSSVIQSKSTFNHNSENQDFSRKKLSNEIIKIKDSNSERELFSSDYCN